MGTRLSIFIACFVDGRCRLGRKDIEMKQFSSTAAVVASLGQWLRTMLLVTIMGCFWLSSAIAQVAQSTQETEARLIALSESSPLAPLPLKSPREAYESFEILSQNATDSILKAIDVASHNNAFFDTPEVEALKAQGLRELLEAAKTLDLSEVAPESRRTVGIEAVLLLKEILERIDLPEISQIPSGGTEGPASWTIPGTEIRLVGLPDSNGTLRYKFSADTVARLPEFYARVRSLPQKTGGDLDFYSTFTLGPGLSAPIELYSYLIRLPPSFLKDYAGQAAWQWMAFGFVTLVLLGLCVPLLARAFGRKVKRTHATRILVLVGLVALLAIYRWLNDEIINMTGQVQAAIEMTVLILQGLTLAGLVIFVFNGLATLVLTLPGGKREGLDASLVTC